MVGNRDAGFPAKSLVGLSPAHTLTPDFPSVTALKSFFHSVFGRPARAPTLPVRRSLGEGGSKRSASKGFTLVEVMMAATILVVGFMGMIQAVTMGSEMLATARRQTLAAQIIAHELEKLRYVVWTNGSTGINDLPAGPTTLTIDSQFNSAITTAGLTTTVSTTNPYVKVDRTVADVVTGSMREVTITVTWQKSGTTANATTLTGSWLENLSLGGSPPIRRTYTRSGTSYFGKYGLNLSYQRS